MLKWIYILSFVFGVLANPVFAQIETPPFSADSLEFIQVSEPEPLNVAPSEPEIQERTPDYTIASTGFSIQSLMRSLIGIAFLILICWIFSTNRRRVNWRLVGSGILLQLFIGYLLLNVSLFSRILRKVSIGFTKVLGFTQEGVDFLFSNIETGVFGEALNNFAFVILPTVIFFSALTSLLFFLGILQKVVMVMAWIMKRTMGLSGSESLAAAGNVFLGQTEAPLLIKPYISGMTRSELMCLMSGGMATIAGGVLGAYVKFLGDGIPELEQYYAMHLITASLLSAPAAIVAAKILVPETADVKEKMKVSNEKIGGNFLEAISNGTIDGLRLAVNVGAMLLVFTAMVATFNFLLEGLIGDLSGLNPEIARVTNGRYTGLNMQFLLGYLGAPVAWALGVPSEDMLSVGQLLGMKTVLNEFYAYYELDKIKSAGGFMHEKSIIMATYILCGFANFASIGIQIGGIGSLAPGRRGDLSKLGFRAMLGGTVACLLTATVVGMYYTPGSGTP
jgi:concentrative nucleoside transporter, CNT family